MNTSTFEYKFGKFVVPKALVIYSSKHFYTIFPPNPRLKGHLLIISKREIESIGEMTNEELFDYSLTLRYIQKKIEGFFQTNSSCLLIQEGEDVGQHINHFHAHVLPRVKGDIADHNMLYNEMPTFDEEFMKEYSELLSNEKNKAELKVMVDKFKDYLFNNP